MRSPPRAPERGSVPAPLWPVVLLAMLAGAIVRAAPVLRAEFPVNDGGLFASMVDDILRTGQPIPELISYNDLGAPFAYPPLAFVATAVLESAFPIGTIEWQRWIPLAASIATIPAFALLASLLLPTRVHAVVATFAFALVPRSFEWMIMGGGLTRAPGLLLAILSIYMGIRFLEREDRSWIAAGVGFGLATLTHPPAGLFTAISLTVAALAYGRSRRAWSRTIVAAGVGLVVLAPWVASVVARHGVAPLLSAGGTSPNLVESVFHLLTARLGDEPLWALTAALAVLGFVFALSRRRWFLPAWPVVLVLADPRGAANYVSVPMAILAAVGLLDLLLARLLGVPGELDAAPGWPSGILRRNATRLVLGGALTLGMISALVAPYSLSPMAALSAADREAMAWSRMSLPAEARVVVVSGRPWFEDATAEWFPYLADRVSVATVQGYEWLGSAAWQRQVDLAADLATGANDTVGALEEWAAKYEVTFDHVYLPKGRLGGALASDDCCSALRRIVRDSADFLVVYDGPGATIARRLRGRASRPPAHRQRAALPIDRQPMPRGTARAGGGPNRPRQS